MDEDDLKCSANEKKISLLLKQFHENFHSKTYSCRKISHFSEIQKDALMHPEDLKG